VPGPLVSFTIAFVCAAVFDNFSSYLYYVPKNRTADDESIFSNS